jgi:hypothetical protein
VHYLRLLHVDLQHFGQVFLKKFLGRINYLFLLVLGEHFSKPGVELFGLYFLGLCDILVDVGE